LNFKVTKKLNEQSNEGDSRYDTLPGASIYDESLLFKLVCTLELINHPGDPLDVVTGGGESKFSLNTTVCAFSRKEQLISSKVKINFLMIMVLVYTELCFRLVLTN
jgi:hypothetical protein